MSSKSIIVFALIFSIQFLLSCYPCDCDPGIVRGAKYTNGEVTALDTSGFSSEIIQDSVDRNSFGLYYQSSFTETSIGEIPKVIPNYSYGFSAALACDCVGDTFKYNDPVKGLDIIIIDEQTSEEKSGNTAFGLFIGTGLQPLDDVDWNIYFNQEWYPDVYLNFELTDEDAVASSSVFKIVLTLESGATLSSETEVVKFFD